MGNEAMNSVRGQAMLAFLPGYYERSRIMKSILDAQGAELDRLWEALDETLRQFYVSTATWGLPLWERELGIAVDPGKPVEQRRSVILSKLRGIGSVTPQLLKTVAEAYDGGTVEVTAQPATYRFTVKFIDTLGVPANLRDLQAAIEEIKPAHLAVDYEYKYFMYNDLVDSGMTYGEMANHTYNDILNKGLT